MTDFERMLWQRLRYLRLGHHFRRQVPLGPFIVDFACLSARLVIELDGSQHLDNQADQRRSQWLRSQGFEILRFWNHQVLRELDSVVETVSLTLEPLSPYRP